ncbi:hypothetical protein [Halalkalirubrum salinum]|nr:hypothetical protein [Halalkalirubrum salinum]
MNERLRFGVAASDRGNLSAMAVVILFVICISIAFVVGIHVFL